MEMVGRMKQLESAWKQGHITSTEYHSLIDYFLNRLAADEIREQLARPYHV